MLVEKLQDMTWLEGSNWPKLRLWVRDIPWDPNGFVAKFTLRKVEDGEIIVDHADAVITEIDYWDPGYTVESYVMSYWQENPTWQFVLEYEWDAADLTTPGEFYAMFSCVDISNQKTAHIPSNEKLIMRVIPHANP